MLIKRYGQYFDKAVSEGRIVFDNNNMPKCAICGASLVLNGGLFVGFTPCDNCDEEFKEKLKADERAKAEAERSAQLRTIENEIRACFDTERAFSQTFENDDLTNDAISKKLQSNYIANFETIYKEKGCGLLLYGGVGTGKTFLARAVLHALIEKGYKAKEIKILKIYNKVCANGEAKEAFLEDLLKKDIVFIDDLGTERRNEGMIEFVYNIIDTLYENNIPIIFTTNIALSEFATPDLDTSTGRIYSRIYGSAIPIEVNKKNKRFEDLKTLIDLWNSQDE